MKRNTLNYVVDTASFICFLLLASTGLLLEFVLPHGSGGRLAVWGMGRHDWGEIHLILGLVLIALMLLHLFLHWNWVVQVTKDIGKHRTGFSKAAAAGLVLVIGLAIAPFLSPVEASGRGQGKHGQVSWHDR